MPCYHPLKAFRDSGGVRVLDSSAALWNLTLPCGQCVGCRLERSRQWAVRCMHEASLWPNNVFLTLTYDDVHLPEDRGLHYDHFQKFMKRLRKEFTGTTLRFYMCGEYGESFGRPHFHVVVFNCDFSDKLLHSKTSSGNFIYRSRTLERLWPFGYSSIGDVTFESAAYVARYVMKKRNGPGSSGHYEILNTETGEIFSRRPEFNKMSLKPGIGAGWFDKYKSDVFPHDHVIVNGKASKPPKYYDKLLKRVDANLFEVIKEKRVIDMNENLSDNTSARLHAKEVCALARVSKLKRSI